MFHVDFVQHLKRYGRERLPELQVQTHDKVGVRGGFVLINRDEGADLMLKGQRLGSVLWQRGEIVYEPQIELSDRLSLDGHFDRWVGQAWQKAQREQ